MKLFAIHLRNSIYYYYLYCLMFHYQIKQFAVRLPSMCHPYIYLVLKLSSSQYLQSFQFCRDKITFTSRKNTGSFQYISTARYSFSINFVIKIYHLPTEPPKPLRLSELSDASSPSYSSRVIRTASSFIHTLLALASVPLSLILTNTGK
ncbi:unnamed protein product [Chrysodeixis includens]|uniref:Uncharacterized protein n=1 Tax=Chrysodeixis includens TaxID=689277 RepID=A0A9P0FXD7_CHRIL|nr:unnamed protein product [Chrysodeixis includens]